VDTGGASARRARRVGLPRVDAGSSHSDNNNNNNNGVAADSHSGDQLM